MAVSCPGCGGTLEVNRSKPGRLTCTQCHKMWRIGKPRVRKENGISPSDITDNGKTVLAKGRSDSVPESHSSESQQAFVRDVSADSSKSAADTEENSVSWYRAIFHTKYGWKHLILLFLIGLACSVLDHPKVKEGDGVRLKNGGWFILQNESGEEGSGYSAIVKKVEGARTLVANRRNEHYSGWIDTDDLESDKPGAMHSVGGLLIGISLILMGRRLLKTKIRFLGFLLLFGGIFQAVVGLFGCAILVGGIMAPGLIILVLLFVGLWFYLEWIGGARTVGPQRTPHQRAIIEERLLHQHHMMRRDGDL